MPHKRLRLSIFAAAASALLLAGCAASAPSPAAGPTESPSASASVYPLTIDNCGTEVTFDSAPERVLTIKSTSTEMLLALGLGDRIVASSFSDGPVSEQWADAAADVPVISDSVPGQEAVLEQNPDLVYAGWESNFSAEGAGDRAALSTLGLNTFVSPAACQEEGYQPNPLTFDDIFDEITQVGQIFDATDAAAALVADQRAALKAVEPAKGDLTALWYSSGSDTPFVGAGSGAPQIMMDAAGLTNIAADIDETWSSLSWEVVIEANPDVIVLVDSAWGSTEKKIGVLEANPVTAQLDAVKNKRYLIVPFPASEAGVRNVETVQSLVDQVKALDDAAN